MKLQAGEYVSLGKVEAELKTCPFVDNICVYGDSSKQYCVALLVPNMHVLAELMEKRGVARHRCFEDMCDSKDVEKIVLQELAEHGKKCKSDSLKFRFLCTIVAIHNARVVVAAYRF